jgi:bacterioferritin (cytochrome b1)
MAKFIYTEDLVNRFKAEYTEMRDAGELNPNVLATIVEGEVDAEGTELSVASLRAKLMIEDVYVKDTDAEKEAIRAIRDAEKAASPKKDRVTKAMVASKIVTKMGIDARLAEDLARVKRSTLDAILAVVDVSE